jgi:hypothetical protein
MAFANGLDLTLSSKQRFIDQANYKHSWFLVLAEDDEKTGLKKNAELIDVRPITGNARRTARAIFRIDREANNVPFNFVEPRNRYIERGVAIQQITADEIIKTYGIGGVVYLAMEAAPDNTQGLAEGFATRFGLKITPEDIVAQPIGQGVVCVMVTFSKMSVGYTGSLRVDITTPVYAS